MYSVRQPSELVQATALPWGKPLGGERDNMAMGDARATFLDAASTAVRLLERPELPEH